jgi:hypothetical protein
MARDRLTFSHRVTIGRSPRGTMPATLLSHQALVLPLKMRWPHRFSGLALCVGSMVPDLEFIGRMADDWIVSHTLTAQLWFTTPVTLLLVWVLAEVMLPALLPYVRDVRWLRPHELAALSAPHGVREWTVAAYSALLGGVSHVLLDAVTHGNHSGWLVPVLPALRTMVPHFGGRVPLHDALQFWLTLVFGAASLCMWRTIVRKRLLWRWRLRVVEPLPRMPLLAGHRLLGWCALAAVQGALVGWVLRAEGNGKALAAAVAFGMIDFAFVALLLAALVVRRRGWLLPRHGPRAHDVAPRPTMGHDAGPAPARAA